MTSLHFLQLLVRISLLLVATGLQLSQGNLHCAKWKQRYEQHDCHTPLEITRDAPKHTEWTSCCVPPAVSTGSGDGSTLTKYNSSVYTISTGTFSKTQVWCDMNTEGGGWLTILRRTKDSKENFGRYREDYLRGFGDLKDDFWLGLRTMQELTEVGEWELRVDLYESHENNESSTYAKYSSFEVKHHPNYTLELGNFTASDATLTDCLGEFSGEDFVVLDDSQDTEVTHHCAVGRGGWWYNKDCTIVGSILTKEKHKLAWRLRDSNSVLFEKHFYRYEMKIRPINCLVA